MMLGMLYKLLSNEGSVYRVLVYDAQYALLAFKQCILAYNAQLALLAFKQ